MSLFQKVPENLFTLFTSKHRDLYVEALFTLLQCYRQEFSIRKNDLAAMLCHSLEEQIQNVTDDEDEIAGKTLSERAHAIIRKFLNTGWLELEPSAQSFEDYLTVPEYAIKLIKTLHEIEFDKPKEYNSFVHNTYVALKSANEERDEYIYEALLAAYRNTEELVDSLRNLLNNMKKYYQQLQEQKEIRELLAEHFDQYISKVSERIYHRIKTSDCVPRFRSKILQILKNWVIDYSLLEQISEQMVLRGHSVNKLEAHFRVMDMIEYITDAYDRIHVLLNEIDKKNSSYIKASVERFQYLLNMNAGTKGKLVDILNQLPNYRSNEEVQWQMLREDLPLHLVSFIDDNSLYTDPKRKAKHNPVTLSVEQEAPDEEISSEYDELKKRFRQGISRKKVISFIQSSLGDKSFIDSSQLQIQDDSDFLKLIMSVLISDESGLPYKVEFKDDSVLINGYQIPEMSFINSKEKKANGMD
ncbi:Wadjet anti-phage system protein JetA family protein [Candidatus Pristimantibacillus sp. PTI5]|uniref:Wadjet anti-phage system protein JetA family protein n=1 Tax=Candidatus Pristimantibacillus sp. PTI5 TaxID=3400422 RepID=UPI003B020BBA